MAYTPNPTDLAAPLDTEKAKTAAAEFRALKAYIQTTLVASLIAGKVSKAGDTMTGTLRTTSNEGIRIVHAGAFISGFNAAETTRTGYLQFNSATGQVVLAADTATAISFNIGPVSAALFQQVFCPTGASPISLGLVTNRWKNVFAGYANFNERGNLSSQLGYTASMATTTASLGQIEIDADVVGAAIGPAMIAFHRPGAFAAYFGLDTDNQWSVGGWSMGANRYPLFHTGNLTNLSQLANGPGYINSSGSISGNAATATKLQTARLINGTAFDGTADISIPGSAALPPSTNPCYMAHRGGVDTYSSAIPVRVAFDVEDLDAGNNGAAGTFTAPATGIYEASWSCHVEGIGGASTVAAQLYLNGATPGAQYYIQTTSQGTANYSVLGCTRLITVLAGQTLDLYMSKVNGASAFASLTTFCVRRIQ